ncbi:MAG: RNA-binding transcriptional accessory protein, partial [Gammaproteobacteria bacterium]
VKVKVMEVDLQRKRIALSMRLSDKPGEQQRGDGRRERDAGARKPLGNQGGGQRGGGQGAGQNQRAGGGTMADAFARARRPG